MNRINNYIPPPTVPKLTMAKALSTNAANNMEEASFKMSEVKDSSKKEKSSSSDATQKRLLVKSINRITNIQKYSKMLDEQDSVEKKFQQIMSAVGKNGGLDKWIEGQSEDEAAVVWLALKRAGNEAKDPAKKLIQARESFFLKDNISQIQASFNVAPVVSKYFPNRNSARKMRKALSRNNGRRKGVRSIFLSLLDAFDEDEFPESVDAYIRSIAQDIDADHPSTEVEYLRDIYERLNAATGVKSLLNFCDDAMLNLKRHIEILEAKPVGLARSLLDLTGDDIYHSEIKSIVSDYVEPDKKSRLMFLNVLYPLLSRLPTSLWSDEEKRHEGIKAFLSYMEQETRKESEYARF